MTNPADMPSHVNTIVLADTYTPPVTVRRSADGVFLRSGRNVIRLSYKQYVNLTRFMGKATNIQRYPLRSQNV